MGYEGELMMTSGDLMGTSGDLIGHYSCFMLYKGDLISIHQESMVI